MLSIAAAALVASVAQADIKITRDMEYGKGAVLTEAKSIPLKLDLYEPATGTGNRPVFVLIHGGGFRIGSKNNMVRFARPLAENGFVAVPVQYRLEGDKPTGHRIDSAVEDVNLAIKWLRENSAKYRLDMDRVVVGGPSAGGITSCNLGYTSLGQGNKLRGVVNLWGGLGGRLGRMQVGPPLLTIHGTADETVPFSSATRIHARAKELGIPSRLIPLEGVGHSVNLDQVVEGKTVLNHIIDFAKEVTAERK